MTDYVDEEQPAQTGQKYLLRKILNGQTLSIGLQRNDYTQRYYDQLSRAAVNSYNYWFSNAVKHIEKTHREEEFADILPILRGGVKIQIKERGDDLNIKYMTLQEIQWECGRGTVGCYTTRSFPPEIYLPSNDGWLWLLSLGKQDNLSIGVHEIGHSLGFSDQYFQARSLNSDAMYGSAEERNTIMKHSGHLTCDDADGLINLIDLTRGTRRRADQGWKTLCPKSHEYYIGGISASKGPYRITLDEDKKSVTLLTYDKGQPQNGFPVCHTARNSTLATHPCRHHPTARCFGPPANGTGAKRRNNLLYLLI